jgi:hypothetical protein
LHRASHTPFLDLETKAKVGASADGVASICHR